MSSQTVSFHLVHDLQPFRCFAADLAQSSPSLDTDIHVGLIEVLRSTDTSSEMSVSNITASDGTRTRDFAVHFDHKPWLAETEPHTQTPDSSCGCQHDGRGSRKGQASANDLEEAGAPQRQEDAQDAKQHQPHRAVNNMAREAENRSQEHACCGNASC